MFVIYIIVWALNQKAKIYFVVMQRLLKGWEINSKKIAVVH